MRMAGQPTILMVSKKRRMRIRMKLPVLNPLRLIYGLSAAAQDSKYNGHSRTYWEDVDWVYTLPDTNTTTAEVEEIVTGMKNANIHVFDDIASPDITLNSITVDGQALEGFNNENTEYLIELPEGTKKAPKVEAKANNQFSIVTVTSPETLPGATTVYVTSSDLSVTKTYHLNFSVKGNSELAAFRCH